MTIVKKVSTGLLAISLLMGGFSTAIAASAVDLGTAANFAVLAGSTVTNTGPTIINGDLGLNPGTSVTGFPPGIINGSLHQTDGSSAQAQTDLTAALTQQAPKLAEQLLAAILADKH